MTRASWRAKIISEKLGHFSGVEPQGRKHDSLPVNWRKEGMTEKLREERASER